MNRSYRLLVASLCAGAFALSACSGGAPPELPDPRPPGLRPTPEQVAFTCVTPGCETQETVQVDVIGPRRVAIKRILLEGAAAEDFELILSEEPPFIVGTNSNFLVEVRYVPKGAPAPGSVGVHITYTDASPEESDDRLEAGELVIPLVRRLVGEPVLTVSPASLSFGVVAPGSTSTLPLTVKNGGFGNIALELSEVTSLDAELLAALPEDGALGPGAALELPVQFAPATERYLATELHLGATPDYVPQVKVMVEGTSLSTARAALQPSSDIDFGLLKKGAERLLQVTLMNQGGAALNVQSVQVNDPAAAVTVTAPSSGEPFTLGPLERVTLPVRVSGASAGEVNAQLVVTSDDPVNPLLTLNVRGTITEPQLAMDKVSLDWGKVPVGWALTEPIELRNVGFGPLTVKNITLVSGTSTLFTLTRLPALPATLGREERTAVEVQFRAETAATFNGWLSIETDDPDAPFVEIPLTAESGTCAESCPISNGTPACDTGTCAVGTCNSGWYDTDKNPATGCECSEMATDPGAFCTGAHNLGTLNDNDNDQATFTGKLPYEGDEDVIRFYGEDGFTWFGEDFDVKVRLTTSDPSIRMCVYRHDGGNSNECYWSNPSCPTNGQYRKTGSAGSEDGANFLVKVFRAEGAAPTCSTYTLYVSNGI